MCFYLHLQEIGCMERAWSEGELKMYRVLALKVLGDGVIAELPDLLFDIKTDDGFISWRETWILFFFGVGSEKVELILKTETFDRGITSFGKEVGFFDLADFNDQKLRPPC